MTDAVRHNRPWPRRAGFTIAELLMSLAVSGTVLAAASALAFAVSHAWAQSEDINEVVSHGRNGVVRLSDRIRSALAVGYTTTSQVLLWREDANGDGHANLSELTLLSVDSDRGQLNEGQILFPANTSQAVRDAHNAAVTPAQFLAAATASQLRNDAFYAQGPLAEHVQQVIWVVDRAPPATRMVQVQLTLHKDTLTQVLQSGMALRAPKEPQ